MSENFEKVQGFYNSGLWPIGWVYNAVGKWITKDKYFVITGEVYVAK